MKALRHPHVLKTYQVIFFSYGPLFNSSTFLGIDIYYHLNLSVLFLLSENVSSFTIAAVC